MSVAMTGTGTQSDPFIPYEWEDFVTAIGTNGAYISLPVILVKTEDDHIMSGKLYFDSEGNRIASPVESEIDDYYENSFKLDANSYAPSGISLYFKGVTIEGNGASIINCYVPDENYGLRFGGTSTKPTNYLNNINFLNLFSESDASKGYMYCDSSRGIFTDNVQFSGAIIRGAFCGANGNRRFKSTTFSLTLGTNASFVNGTLNTSQYYYQFCLFDFYGSPTNVFRVNSGNKFLNCKMTGKLTGTSGEIPIFPSDSTSTTCVMDIDVTEYTGVTFNYDGSNPYIINTDKIPSGTVHTNMTGVTSEQMLDASYLRSVGFPCVGD